MATLPLVLSCGGGGGGGGTTTGGGTPIDPQGNYTVTYNPSSVIETCTVTNTSTGATSQVSVTVPFSSGTLTITKDTSGNFTATSPDGESFNNVQLTCDSNSCTGSYNATVVLTGSDPNLGPYTVSEPVAANNIVITSNSIAWSETIGTITVSYSNHPEITESCTVSPNTINVSGTKQ